MVIFSVFVHQSAISNHDVRKIVSNDIIKKMKLKFLPLVARRTLGKLVEVKPILSRSVKKMSKIVEIEIQNVIDHVQCITKKTFVRHRDPLV